MNKKLMLIVPMLLVLVTGSVYVTRALFSDTERSEDSTFTAGTLNMDVDNNDGVAFDNIVINNIGVDGTVSGGKTWTVNNSGSVAGNLSLSIAQLQNFENGCNEPEAIVDTSCATPGLGEGDLGAAISTTVLLDTGSGDTQIVSSDLTSANQDAYATQWVANGGVVTIPAGGSATVTFNWATDPSSYGNEIQSDSLDFDVQFDLEQVSPN